MQKMQKIDEVFDKKENTKHIVVSATIICVILLVLLCIGKITIADFISIVTIVILMATLFVVSKQTANIKAISLSQYQWDKRKTTTDALETFREKMRAHLKAFKAYGDLWEYVDPQRSKKDAIPLDVLHKIMYDESNVRTGVGDEIVDFLNLWEHLSLSVRYKIYDFNMVNDIMGNLVVRHYEIFRNLIMERNKGADGTSDCKACNARPDKVYQRSWCEFCGLSNEIKEKKHEKIN